MRRASRLAVVLGGLLASSVSAAFKFDGSSSDLAQKFRDLYDDSQGDASAPLTLATIPSDIQTRLNEHSLKFEDLPSLLQHALMWDSGYVAVDDSTTKFTSIYTRCNSTMADIALSRRDVRQSGCEPDACSDPYNNNATTYRSLNCSSVQIAAVSRCASTKVSKQSSSSMWATGGNTTFFPTPNVVRHDSNGSDLIYAIHMVNAETFYDSCPTDSLWSFLA